MSACERINSIAWDDTYCFDKMADWIDFSFGSVFIVLIGAQELNFYRATTHKQQQQKTWNELIVQHCGWSFEHWQLEMYSNIYYAPKKKKKEDHTYIYIYIQLLNKYTIWMCMSHCIRLVKPLGTIVSYHLVRLSGTCLKRKKTNKSTYAENSFTK